jgi:hypothetical protein
VATAQPYPNPSTDRHCRFFEPREAPFPVAGWVRNTQKAIASSCNKLPSPFASDDSIVKFTLMVESSGKISNLAIKDSSNSKEADEHYAELIRQASPFSPAPKTLSAQAGSAMNITPKLYKGPFEISITKAKVTVQPVRQEN